MSEHANGGNGQARATSPPQRAPGGYDQWFMTQLNDLSSRISSLETEVKHLATKDDVSRTKLWVLVGALGGIIAITGIIFTILRYMDLPP